MKHSTHVPISTYRIQFTPEFNFEKALPLISYLKQLGISDIYASPIFAATPGSQHGYDVVDPTRINPELGDEAKFRSLVEASKQHGLGWLQDIVPNHQAFHPNSFMLMDILERGPRSRFYDYYDILWQHPYSNINGRLLAPFLGDFYSNCLERGELSVCRTQGRFLACYYDWRFPLRIESYAEILEGALAELLSSTHRYSDNVTKLKGLIQYIKTTLTSESEPTSVHLDANQFVKSYLLELCIDFPVIENSIDRYLALLNGNKGDSTSFVRLDKLLSEQFFRLAYWKVGTDELNYRRFFTINGLISMRAENEEVFQFTHDKLFELAAEGLIDGIRIDHIDGLADPHTYLERIRRKLKDKYVVVEKILELEEDLPRKWPIQGTSGYDFLAQTNALFCQSANRAKFSQIYRELSGDARQFSKLVVAKKRMVISSLMAGDIDNLALLLKETANRYWYGKDLTLYGLRRALVEVLAHFPVYRTYANYRHFDRSEKSSCEMFLPSVANLCLPLVTNCL